MFGDWTDPYDIDNYYNDMNKLMGDVKPAPSGAMYQRPEVFLKPTAPTVPSPIDRVDNFEVRPNTIAQDNHPVGSQPSYNLLRSGGNLDNVHKEKNKEQYTPYKYDWHDGCLLICSFSIFLLFILYIAQSMKTNRMRSEIDMLSKMFILCSYAPRQTKSESTNSSD